MSSVEDLSDDSLTAQVALLAASSPSREHESLTLRWAREGKERDNEVVTAYIITCLRQGYYDAANWVLSALAQAQSSTIRDLVKQWALIDDQAFFSACVVLYDEPTARLGILLLVLDVLLEGPIDVNNPSADTIMRHFAQHDLLTMVLRSLLYDTSNVIFPFAIRTVLCAVPFAPSELRPHVPLLMVVLGRAICWRDRPFIDAGVARRPATTETPLPVRHVQWRLATSSHNEDVEIPIGLQSEKVAQLWLIAMYGLWPSNVLAFVRDPVSYMVNKGVQCVYECDWADIWAPGLLASRSAPMLRDFALHPSISHFTSAQELDDTSRWDKLDPSEIVARSHVIAHSDRFSRGRFDFFTETEIPEEETDTPEAVSSVGSVSLPGSVSKLQREVLILRVEAMFSDRLLKQYIHHIGRLHKHTLRFSSDEAEIHTFVNRLKDQGKLISSLTTDLAQQKNDATSAQQRHGKWQERLRDNLTTLREERRGWQTETARVRTELAEALILNERQKVEIADLKHERFNLQNRLTEMLPKIAHIDDYEKRIQQISEIQNIWELRNARAEAAEHECSILRGRCYQVEQRLRAQLTLDRSRDAESTRKSFPPQERTSVINARPSKNLDSLSSLPRESGPSAEAAVFAAKDRMDRLERENLELRVALERLMFPSDDRVDFRTDRTFIWGMGSDETT